MAATLRLGGFKILDEVTWISVFGPGIDQGFPARFCRMLAHQKINMPFLNCSRIDRGWAIDAVVAPPSLRLLRHSVNQKFPDLALRGIEGNVLSLFPHRENPEIVGRLLQTLGNEGVDTGPLSQSNAAVSVVLPRIVMGEITEALFYAFQFSKFRTPEDWRLSREGRESLYREVVASYQERQPKIYFLQWQDGQDILDLTVRREMLGTAGAFLNHLALQGLSFNFLVGAPFPRRPARLFFNLPLQQRKRFDKAVRDSPASLEIKRIPSMALFSMNGPHFGDRYGIAGRLLEALADAGLDLFSLSCSIASIMGALPADQIESAVGIIQDCFEVPATFHKPAPS